MPDLTNDPIGANYRRAIVNFSRFGTRKLAYYAIRVYGISDDIVGSIDGGEDTYDPEFPREWIETPGNILEAVQRGVQLIAEPYTYSDWDINQLGPNYHLLLVTAVVAADTILDDRGQQDSPVPANQNSYSLQTAIEDALGQDFSYDYVEVERMILRGDFLDTTGDYALGRNNAANSARQIELMNTKVAAGKISLKRKP